MTMLDCPTPNDVAAFVDGSMASSRERELESHVESCATCRELVTAVRDTIGRYSVIQRIGEGGMGVVYEAHDPELDRRVAIKVMRTAHHERLVEEARAMAQLAHPNVVSVFEIGRTERGRLFLVMELVAGSTLRDWLAPSRSWRDIVATFVEAGRGLAAAHAAGLVHRDFKPSNVLVSDDGRVRVSDFGLVRSATTFDRTAVGTPPYMSPEQLAGEDVDARSDQFSFCVALARALPASKRRHIPRRIHRAIVRGMSSDRDDRYATMNDLLRQLEPRRRMIHVSLALGLASAIGVGAFAIALASREDPSASCGVDRMTSMWRTMGPTVEARFAASGKGFSAGAFAEVDRMLVKRASQWQAMREDLCAAPRDELASLRETCLDQRLAEARAFADALVTATPAEIERAPAGVHQLADLQGCVEPAMLLGPVRLPTAPDERARIASLRGELAEVQAIDRLGRHATAAVRASDLAAKARATRYRPLEAEVELELGLALFDAGKFPESVAALRDARFAAEAGRADDVEIRALIQLMYYESIVDKHDDAAVHDLAPRIEAALERIGGDTGLAGDFHLALAWMARGANRFADLDRESAAALAAISGHAGADDLAVAPALIARIWSEGVRGDGASETALARRLIEIRTRALGERHPDVGEAYLLLAEGLKRTPAFADADAAYARAVSIEEAAFGPDHWRMMHLHTQWGMYAADRGRLREARVHLDRSLAIARETSGVHGRAYGEARMWIGAILTDQGLDSEALAALDESAAIFAASLGHDDFDTIAQELAMSNVLTHLRRFGEARTHLDASLALLDRVVGRDHPWSLPHYWLRGVLALETGHADAALGDFAHARAVADRRDPGTVQTLADLDFDEARALAALHREPERARKLAESARDVYRAYPELVTRRGEIDRWLAR